MKFRKKPVVIEAFPLYPEDGTTRQIPPMWFIEQLGDGGSFKPHADGSLDIETLEGTMHASVGDWIIQGAKGEFYPCKPDIFVATYEPA